MKGCLLQLCMDSSRSKERQSLQYFLVQYPRPTRSLWILKSNCTSKQVRSCQSVSPRNCPSPGWWMPQSIQGFPDVRDIFAEPETAFSHSNSKRRTLVWPQHFCAFIKYFVTERSLGCLNECMFHEFSSGSFSICCQSSRDTVSCCQVLRLQIFYCSRFKLDFQATAFKIFEVIFSWGQIRFPLCSLPPYLLQIKFSFEVRSPWCWWM